VNIKEFAQAIVDGKRIEAIVRDGWGDVDYREAFVIASNTTNHLRIKPELTPVDLSVLVDSGIDCVFTGGQIGKLYSVVGENYNMLIGGCQKYMAFSRCTPRLNSWHAGGNMTDSCDRMAERLVTAGFNVLLGVADCSNSLRINSDLPLINGFCMPWEMES